MWCLRARPSGWPFRRGWLAQQAPPTFAAFRPPLQHREWPTVAGLSAKHTGGVPAGATVFPTSRYPFCPAQYLRHLAEPLAEAAAACNRSSLPILEKGEQFPRVSCILTPFCSHY